MIAYVEVPATGPDWSFLTAVAVLITAVVGAYAVYRKVKPETTNISITGADKAVDIVVKGAQFVQAQRDDLAEQVRVLSGRMDGLQSDFRAEKQAREVAERRAVEAQKQAEVAEERASEAEAKVRKLERENRQLRARLEELESQFALLRAAQEEDLDARENE